METPMTFTLDQLLSLTPIFRDKFYSVARNSSPPLVLQKFQQNVDTYQVHPEDVDFTMPTVKVEWNDGVYEDVLLDGISGDQRRVQAIGMLRSQPIKVHGFQFLTILSSCG